MPSEEDAKSAEESAFQEICSRDRESEEAKCPSLRSIPRFFHRADVPTDEARSLSMRIQRAARAQLVSRKASEELLCDEDIHKVYHLMQRKTRNGELLDYESFRSIGEELVQQSQRFKPFFKPSVFLKFPRDRNGCIAIWSFVAFLVRRTNVQQMHVQLMDYDVLCRGYLREKDMENFVFELIPSLPALNSLQEEFYPFYVFTAVRKFFFFLDPKHTGRIHIRDLLSSSILEELYELRKEQPLEASEAASNWFSMQSALRVYGAYLELDIDQNGMLSRSELCKFGTGMLSDVFIDRVFEEYQTYRDAETGEREMDYKTFLDFVLAMENKSSPQAIQYFWKVLDIHHCDYIDHFVLTYFFRAIVRTLHSKGMESADADDVKNEIFDMIRPEDPERISLPDFMRYKQGGTVISMLTDAAAFWRYDNRETLLCEPQDADILSDCL